MTACDCPTADEMTFMNFGSVLTRCHLKQTNTKKQVLTVEPWDHILGFLLVGSLRALAKS